MILLCCIMLPALLLRPAVCIQAAQRALTIWGCDVIPSLFPYMVLCRMLANRLKNANASPFLSAIVLGLAGGSPSGAAVLAAYGHRFSSKELLPLCAITGTISPMFFLGTIRAWTQDSQLSQMLLIAHYGGAVFSALIIRLIASGRRTQLSITAPHQHTQQREDNPIMQSAEAIVNIGGCIVFYSVAAAMLLEVPFLRGTVGAIFHAVLEAAGGSHAFIEFSSSIRFSGVWLSGFMGFSGLSILSQNLYFLSPLGIKMQHLIACGLLRAAGSALVMAALIRML